MVAVACLEPGASHADTYMFGGVFTDSGQRSGAELACIFRPATPAWRAP